MKLYSLINNLINIKNNKFTLIIGETPSEGARSPILWNKVYKKLKKNINMYPADVSKNRLKELFDYLRNEDKFLGAAVTTPYKELSINFLNKIDSNAKKIGSINTIVKENNKLIGYNTDYFGSFDTLNNLDVSKNGKILILGCGGAGKSTIASVISIFKNNKLIFFNRNLSKLKNFIRKFKISKKNILILNSYKKLYNLKNLDLIINTTSIGFNSWIRKNMKFYNLCLFTPLSKIQGISMVKKKDINFFLKKNIAIVNKNDEQSTNFFKNNSSAKIFDIIYNPINTKLMNLSNNKDNVLNGLNMNLMQAVAGFMLVNKMKNKKLIYNIMKK